MQVDWMKNTLDIFDSVTGKFSPVSYLLPR